MDEQPNVPSNAALRILLSFIVIVVAITILASNPFMGILGMLAVVFVAMIIILVFMFAK